MSIAEIADRRTFAISSHPDAGKTTLTEMFLLYAGALGEAGSVTARSGRRSTTSDWTEMEQKRGITITSTVLQFPYRGVVCNLLDTPGHRDFSEDTYRVLAAVDSVVMVLDSAKGIEPQTLKLFEVCRLRRLPVLTFLYKFDGPGREVLELFDEIEAEIGLRPTPVPPNCSHLRTRRSAGRRIRGPADRTITRHPNVDHRHAHRNALSSMRRRPPRRPQPRTPPTKPGRLIAAAPRCRATRPRRQRVLPGRRNVPV